MPKLFRLEEDGFQLDLPYQYLKANLPTLKLHCFGFIYCLDAFIQMKYNKI